MRNAISSSLAASILTVSVLLALPCEPAFSAPFQHKKAAAKGATTDKLLLGDPFTLDQLLRLLDVHPDRLSKAIENRGLAFQASPHNLDVLRKAGASHELIEVVRSHAPVPKIEAPRVVAAPPPSGGLVLKCSPAECNISLDGKSSGPTKSGELEMKGLPVKDVVVDFEKDGYVSQQRTITIVNGKDVSSAVALEPTNATKEQFGAGILAMTVQALGGDEGLKDTSSVSGYGAMVLWDKDGQRSDWTLNTLVKLPDMALFDLEGSSANFWISLVGDKYKSGGDKNRGQTGGEFDSGLRVFRDFQMAALIGRLKNGEFRVSANTQQPDDAGELHLNATGKTEGYVLTLDNNKLPTRLQFNSELGLGSGMEVLYSNFTSAGKGKYPLAMVIKLPDAPHHGLEIQFEKVALNAELREKDFGHKFKPKK